jgi:hypothetical protein
VRVPSKEGPGTLAPVLSSHLPRSDLWCRSVNVDRALAAYPVAVADLASAATT